MSRPVLNGNLHQIHAYEKHCGVQVPHSFVAPVPVVAGVVVAHRVAHRVAGVPVAHRVAGVPIAHCVAGVPVALCVAGVLVAVVEAHPIHRVGGRDYSIATDSHNGNSWTWMMPV